MRRPLVIYDFATAHFWISFYMRKKNFYQCTMPPCTFVPFSTTSKSCLYLVFSSFLLCFISVIKYCPLYRKWSSREYNPGVLLSTTNCLWLQCHRKFSEIPERGGWCLLKLRQMGTLTVHMKGSFLFYRVPLLLLLTAFFGISNVC